MLQKSGRAVSGIILKKEEKTIKNLMILAKVFTQFKGMKTLDFAPDFSREELAARIYRLLAANGMSDGVHIRLMVSRGIKATPYQDPRVTVTPPTVVIIPEYKVALPETVERGVRLYTVYVRRGYADVQDPTLNTLQVDRK